MSSIKIVPEKSKSSLDKLTDEIDSDPAFQRVVNPRKPDVSSGEKEDVSQNPGACFRFGKAKFVYTDSSRALLRGIELGIRMDRLGKDEVLFPAEESSSEEKVYTALDNALLVIAYAVACDRITAQELLNGIRSKISVVEVAPGVKLAKNSNTDGRFLTRASAGLSLAYEAVHTEYNGVNTVDESAKLLIGIDERICRGTHKLYESEMGSKEYVLLDNALLAARVGLYTNSMEQEHARELLQAIVNNFERRDQLTGFLLPPEKRVPAAAEDIDFVGSLAACLAYRILGEETKASDLWWCVSTRLCREEDIVTDSSGRCTARRILSVKGVASEVARSTRANALYLLNMLAAAGDAIKNES